MDTRFVYHRTIKMVEERHEKRWVSGTGDHAVFEDVSIGWYVTFKEEPSAMFLGMARTGLSPGDLFRITGEKVGEGGRPLKVV